jgi:pimeloyl-ACP methyl ester carboxylesterase
MHDDTGEAPPERLRVNDIDLAVWTAGEGPPVLLLHGFPDTHAVWRRQISVLVEAGYRVIAPDLRGCGQSDAPEGVRAYTIEHLVADVLGLLDALGIDRVKLVAHDWGAVIGWQFCIRHPERVERYAALSVGHPNAYARAGLMQKLKGYYILLFQLRGLIEMLLRAGNWWMFRTFTGCPEEFPQWRASLERPGRLTAAIDYYRANLRMLFKADWPAVRVPVMGVWSSRDIALVERQMTESRRFVDAPWRYERIEGATHWLQLDAPERVNALLIDFLR